MNEEKRFNERNKKERMKKGKIYLKKERMNE
jgi:hypothetical protein